MTLIRPSTSSTFAGEQRLLGDLPLETGGDLLDDGVGAGPRPRTGDDVVSRLGDDFDEAGPHDAGSDDADDVDLSHAESLVTHR